MHPRPTLALAACLTVCGCGGQDGLRPGDGGLRFSDVSVDSGVDLVNVSGNPDEKTAIPESLGQGAAAIDFDSDGRLDLFVANGDSFDPAQRRSDSRPALYRNRGDGTFSDVTEAAGLLFHAWCHGVSRVDFDADGHPDLYVTVSGGPNRFFRNRGDGTFEDRSAAWGGADDGPSTAAAFFDADGDGDLDLYVGNYVHYDPRDPPNKGEPCEWRGLSVFCGPKGTTPARDNFFENRDGALVAANEAFGFGEIAPSYTLGLVAGDFDNDGDLDLYAANDSEANYFFENLGGRFQEVGMLRGVDRNEDGRSQAGMGVDFADVDNDGRFDLFVTNFSQDTNTLYRNLLTPGGQAVFEDATNRMKLGLDSYRYLSWGTRIVDLDHDGWQDIVVASGHVYPEVDTLPVGTSYRQRNQIFRNLGPTEGRGVVFEAVVPGPGSALDKSASSRGLVAADLDNDGDHDLFFVEMDEPPTMLRNDSDKRGHWIGFRLAGGDGNTEAVGARVEVEDSGGTVRLRERSAGGSYLSSGDPRLLFGLGSAGGPINRVSVRWPGGKITTHEGLNVDRYWRLDASGSAAEPLD